MSAAVPAHAEWDACSQAHNIWSSRCSLRMTRAAAPCKGLYTPFRLPSDSSCYIPDLQLRPLVCMKKRAPIRARRSSLFPSISSLHLEDQNPIPHIRYLWMVRPLQCRSCARKALPSTRHTRAQYTSAHEPAQTSPIHFSEITQRRRGKHSELRHA
jgi:hypothetical protein